MTGWGDESYDAAAAGGWNDTSFGASDQGAGQFRTDKIPFPATVKDLSTLATSEEKLVVGKSVFTTIRVVGKVKQSTETDGGQSVEYQIGDFDDPMSSFLIIHYRGVLASDAANNDVVVEGTDVSVVGKLRSFNDRVCIIAFDVREIENKKEIDAFHLEARLARLYYTKNVPEMVLSGRTSRLDGTMLQCAARQEQQAAVSTSGWTPDLGPSAKTLAAREARRANEESYCRGLAGQRAEIFKFLRSNGDEVVGASLEDIRTGIPRSRFNARTFDSDIEYLASEGLIYATSDDDHYAANA